MTADDARIRVLNDASPNRAGRFVLYWMVAARRLQSNFALERAVDLARELDRPLVVLEALRTGYPHASDRLHRFVLDGMRANAGRAERRKAVLYHPYVEPESGAGRGLLAALAKDACAVVTDDYPTFFLPRMVAAAAEQVPVRMEAVDGNGLLPLAAAERAYTTAHSFRAFLQKVLPGHLERMPRPDPLARRKLPQLDDLPAEVRRRWPAADAALLEGDPRALAALPIDHDVAPVATRGGTPAGTKALKRFVEQGLPRYVDEAKQPSAEATSGLSPYLHFGHVSAHQVLAAIAEREDWSPGEVSGPLGGNRQGWWGTSPEAEAFLDQAVTWRELGHVFCAHHPRDHGRFASLPDWARGTLEAHSRDERPHVYTRAQLDAAETHDELWNAAQRQLRMSGRLHNYMRMLWGKKVLEWSKTPRGALKTLLHLNDRYALDGRDPNSNSGIFWTLGRFDRPWGPERPIYGTVRYMSSENTARKLRVNEYLERYGPGGDTDGDN